MGRYRLEARLGRGGMGTVWRAHDELLGRRVAVKELYADAGGGGSGGAGGAGGGGAGGAGGADTDLDATLREARAVARVHHPHIVCVHDVVEEDGVAYIVMELVEGASLAERIAARGPVDAPEAARIGLALLSALRAAHAIGVLHRDLKPANVLVEDATGRVVLSDFGIAQLAGATTLTEANMFVGSPEYTAPERMQGHQAGPAADLWSLGVLLCAVMTGRSPFHRDSLGGVLHAVVEAEILPPAATGPLLPVVRGLLERDPARRLDVAGAERLLRAYVTGVTGGTGVVPGAGVPGAVPGAGVPGVPGGGAGVPLGGVGPVDAPAAHDRPAEGQGDMAAGQGDAPTGARSHAVPPPRARDRVRHMARVLPGRSSPSARDAPAAPAGPEAPVAAEVAVAREVPDVPEAADAPGPTPLGVAGAVDRGPAAPTLPVPPPAGAEPQDAVLPDAVLPDAVPPGAVPPGAVPPGAVPPGPVPAEAALPPDPARPSDPPGPPPTEPRHGPPHTGPEGPARPPYGTPHTDPPPTGSPYGDPRPEPDPTGSPYGPPPTAPHTDPPPGASPYGTPPTDPSPPAPPYGPRPGDARYPAPAPSPYGPAGTPSPYGTPPAGASPYGAAPPPAPLRGRSGASPYGAPPSDHAHPAPHDPRPAPPADPHHPYGTPPETARQSADPPPGAAGRDTGASAGPAVAPLVAALVVAVAVALTLGVVLLLTSR
ncbi:protein kinase domain-containing protein [Streptomyces fradiae]|uniref:serine/threonine-protein kinase n=1 Tax=Streptomyces fradiae TaxID=1906 RepID=UPI0039866BC7